MGNYNSSEEKEVAYDLRQRYALQLGDIRQKIIESRQERNFPEWFSQLDSLYIEISMKLKKEQKKEYKKISGELNVVIKNNKIAYTNKKADGREISSKLREINIWLNEMMEEYNLFGSKFQDDGL